ncbi:MAG: GTP cyclohydrolase I FolE2 [Xanthomonadales bacterium]|uniref:GTP cyclohydrolase FolE2 n=1 Tax=Hydrogenophaga sp. TaxID=1904254 RepID=UPI0016B2B40F|nr:GTP cyclohydrolase FolE2 [Hydrogenophaga sp.]NIM70556.1 GTP cyclohydrolase I FolE2 [Xanthomonadales bacterium]NIN32878.1 GTP cyclohydrolase I FolE2 [Hydrogenophaga sp.]NIN59931.1 GTP cyclohydrolase I FolE2 [Xanthomonadales bacterium]NIN75305.1 GTP cyclohydrolase I FolE2 [Xanthomonadales bacterium]NIO12511.1 GTP cyclohydrolase I FolE2 [Xanthomonadales bacterium]
MKWIENLVRDMPDIANDGQVAVGGKIEWVGMNEIEVPVRIEDDAGNLIQSTAIVTAYVNLVEPDVRGIHMSRLYLHLDQAFRDRPLSPAALRQILRSFLESHEELSDRALVRVDFDYVIRRRALTSDNEGWRRYPVSMIGILEGQEFSLEMGLEILYSSTCPCSAALARQIIQEKFQQDFDTGEPLDFEQVKAWLGSESGIVATPHSQRSAAELRVRLLPTFRMFPIIELIDLVEGALKTPVQATVKREDEQAFALLNGTNLMFCEDAARRIKIALNSDERILDYWARCTHFESLHPHNAVSVITKGVKGGYVAGAGSPVRLDHSEK